MKKEKYFEASLGEVNSTVDTTNKKGIKKILPFLGPAYLVSVGYMDPGNWATDLQGGARFGYQLIWVLLMSNIMALLLQSLSVRLGIVRRRDLAQANREEYPAVVNFCLYILAELAIAACDLAEVLGMAIGLHLLTGIPIIYGVFLTVLDTFILLFLQNYGIRKMEAFIISLVAVVGFSFLIELFFASPDLGEVAKGFVPTPLDNEALYIAVGIIGATVMPHNLYLHSALVQTRKIQPGSTGIKKALKYNFIDTTIALNAAFFVNAAILVLAASAFFATGNTQVARIEEAHQLLEPMLGSTIAPLLFAIALIAAGQSSTVTGTLAGQIVMEGYLHLRISPWIRRLLTRLIAIIPAVIAIIVYGDNEIDDLLVLSQVVLSIQLGYAVIPLIHFVSDKKTMGKFVIGFKTKVFAWIIAAVLIFLNIRLVAEESMKIFESNDSIFVKILTGLVILFLAWLFIMMALLPVIKKRKQKKSVELHSNQQPLVISEVPEIKKVAIALDFSKNDQQLINYAIAQRHKSSSYLLLHIVETVSATYLGNAADDYETQKDLQRLQTYAGELRSLGYSVEVQLGFHNRVSEIIRIVKEHKIDLLVMGAHRHMGLKDAIYGETVDRVRHRLSIPVLIVNPESK